MADPNYTPTRVLLHDPVGVDNPKSLYPITGINCITVGTSGTDATTYIIDSGTTKINSAYLGIVSGTTVASQYLPFAYVVGATNSIGGPVFANSDLDIFDGQGLIKSDLLPSYVDDVVEVPVIDNIASATGPLVILKGITNSVATYTFYEPSTSTGYIPGGGEAGKIYVAETTGSGTVGDGSIYRCVTGSTTSAVKISENPYAVDTSKTNGVYLDTTNGTLTAKADAATYNDFGTIKVDSATVNNVKLLIAGGILSVSAGLANGNTPGGVYAVGTDADYATLQSAYGDVSLVPTVKYMQEYVSGFVPAVAVATSETLGIVQIGSNINVSSGIISVPNAAASVNGVVKIVDVINTAAEGNSSKAVTQGGIVQYVAGQLNNYQSSLVPGNGIDITDNTISAKVYGAIVFSGTNIAARNAAADSTGVIRVTSDQSVIANGSNTLGDDPVAVNPVAVSKYVSGVSSAIKRDVDGAFGVMWENVINSAYTAGDGLSRTLIHPELGSAYRRFDVITTGAAYVIQSGDNAGKLTVSSATNEVAGVVKIVETSAGINDAADAGKAPTASAVSAYVSGATAGVYGAASALASGYSSSLDSSLRYGFAGVYTSIYSSIFKGIDPVYVTSSTSNVSHGLHFVNGVSGGVTQPLYLSSVELGAPGYLDIYDASSNTRGVVRTIVSGAHVSESNYSEHVPTANAVKEYVASAIEDVAPIASSSGISVLSSGGSITIGAKVTGAIVYDNTGNMYVQDAALGFVSGIVSGLVTSSGGIESTGSANAVPTAAAVKAYVTGKVGDAKPIGSSSGVLISASTNGTQYIGANIQEDNALTFDGNGAMYVQAAATGLVAGVVSGLVTTSDGIEIEGSATAVPTASAVAGYVTDKIAGIPSISSGNGINITDSGGSITIGAKVTGAIDFNSDGQIYAKFAASGASGIVSGLVTSSSGMESTGSASSVPTAGAVVEYVTDKIAEIPTISSGSGISITESGGSKIIATKATGAIVYDGADNMYVQAAAAGVSGIVSGLVTTSNGIESTESATAVPTASAVAGYVADKITGITPISQGNGIDITEVGGSKTISVNNTGPIILSGSAITVQIAGVDTLGVAMVSDTTGGLTVTSSGYIQANTAGAILISGNAITARNATVGSTGVVAVKNTSAGIVGAENAHDVPNCAGLVDYVTSYTSATYQKPITAGAGLILVSGSTIDAVGVWPASATADNISVNIASAMASTAIIDSAAVKPAYLGAVYVRNGVRNKTAIDADNYAANTVPTEQAVRSLVDAIPYITYTVIQ